MRLGWLLLGLLFMFYIPVGSITLLPLLGFLLIFYAVSRLEKFEAVFGRSKYVLYAAIPVSAVMLALQIWQGIAGEAFPAYATVTYTVFRLLCEACEMGTMFFIYLGVKTLGENADVKTLTKQPGRNMSVMFVFFLVETVFSILNLTVPQVFDGFEIVLLYPFAFGLIWRGLNAAMIFTCIWKIAPMSEEDIKAQQEQLEREAEEQRRKARNKRKNRSKKKKK